MNIGDKILMFRTLTGESQTDLGNSLGVTQRMMAMYQKATTNLPAKVKEELCIHFGINELWFIQGNGNIFSNRFTAIYTKIPQEQIVRSRIINTLKRVIRNQLKEQLQEYAVKAYTVAHKDDIIIFELKADEHRNIDQYLMLSTPVVDVLVEMAVKLEIPLDSLDYKGYTELLNDGITVIDAYKEADKKKALDTICQLMDEHDISIKDIDEHGI